MQKNDRVAGLERLRVFLLENKKALLFALFLFYLYFRGIGDHGLLDPLEGVNASVGLDMLINGRAFDPHVGEAACAGRALGTWWLSTLAIRLLGWQERAARFWPALSGLLMALAAALSVKRPRGKWLAAALCASTTLGFAASQLASPHALYACCAAFAMVAMLRPDRRGLLAGAAALAALITYGPEGLILPWAALFIFVLVTDRIEILRAYLPGLGLSLLGALAWVLLLWLKNPRLLLFMTCETPKFLKPTWQLALMFLFGGSLPWPGFLIRALWEALSSHDSEGTGTPAENPGIFMAVWALTFALGAFLTGDLLALAACVPPLAALTGASLDRWIEGDEMGKVQEAVALNLVIVVLAVAAGIPFASRAFPALRGAMLTLAPWGLFLVLFTFAAWHYARTRQPVKLARNASAVALLCLLPLAGVFDLLAEGGAIRNIGLALRGEIQRGNVAVQYAVNHPSLYFYTLNSYATVDGPALPGVVKSELSNTALHLLWDGRDRAFLMIPQNQQVKQPLPQDVYSILEADGMSLLSNRSH